MRVVRTSLAEEDLVGIWINIAKESKAAADRVVDDLDRKTSVIGRHPEIGRERPDIAAGLRYFPSGNYLILYRVLEDHVEIVRYVHGRRDLKRLV